MKRQVPGFRCRVLGLALLGSCLLYGQVAKKANEGYKTPEGREGVAKSLDAPDRDEKQKPQPEKDRSPGRDAERKHGAHLGPPGHGVHPIDCAILTLGATIVSRRLKIASRCCAAAAFATCFQPAMRAVADKTRHSAAVACLGDTNSSNKAR